MLKKSRRRDPHALDFGGFILIEARPNCVILGGSPNEFSATLDEVESYFDAPPR